MAPQVGRLLLSAVALLLAAGTSRALAEGPPVDTKRFPKLTHVFLLPEERALLKELKDDKDRREFQRIFWARRDPTPGTPANEFEDNVRAAWKNADERLLVPEPEGIGDRVWTGAGAARPSGGDAFGPRRRAAPVRQHGLRA